MAQNIQVYQDLADHPTANIQTVNRPIIIGFEYTSGAPTPKFLSLQVFVEIDGSWVEAGGEQIATRTQTSAAALPKFTLDVSSLLKGYIEENLNDALKTLSSSADGVSSINSASNITQKNVIKYKVEARSWYVGSDNLLIQNITDAAVLSPASGARYACDIFVKDEAIISSKYSNITFSQGAQNIGWNINGTFAALSNKNFLTNCPEGLTRKLPINQHLFISHLNRGFQSNGILEASYYNDANTLTTSSIGATSLVANGLDLRTQNLTASNTYLYSQLAGATTTGIKDGRLEVYIKQGGSHSKKLKFEVINGYTPTNQNLNSLPKDACSIVFINDFNVFDFYLFDSFLDVTHQQETTLYKTGYKDYTRRESSKRGVSRGKTTEVYTCSTIVNREASEWLSEIYRSRKVYLYDLAKGVYVPIIVLDNDIRVSYANNTEFEPFSLSFIKDVNVVNS